MTVMNRRRRPRIARQIERHYTPKHGSWLNIAKIEINVLSKQRLVRRIPGSRDAGQQGDSLAEKAQRRKKIRRWAIHTREGAKQITLPSNLIMLEY